MSIQHFGKATLRVAKNYTKGYSDVQAKVREATSNDPWGPSGTQMNEIAQMSYNQNDFVEVMEMLDKRLNDKGKNWRHVFKALTVLDYLLHAGSENVVIYFRDNIYIIKTLKEFQYVDEYSKDQGANVRQKAKDITNLLQDESRLRQERRTRADMRDRMAGGGSGDGDDDDENARRRSHSVPPGGASRRNKDDDELRKAIEASKRSLQEEQAKTGAMTASERDLMEALKLSEEDEKRRNKSIEDSNSRSLFDEQNQPASPSTNPFPLVNPSIQPQFTQMQPQFTSMAPQFTSFNPYQQQAEQEAMQAAYLQQQQDWARQQQEAQAQAQMQAQMQAQAQQQQAQEEWNRQQQFLQYQQQQQQQQQLQAQQPLAMQPTGFGTNNPFALGQSPGPSAHSPSQQYSQSTNSPLSSFSLPSSYANSNSNSHSPTPVSSGPSSSGSPAPSMGRPTNSTDAEHAHLANLFANREDGLDSFGNMGNLRFGHSNAGRIVAQQTSNSHNPFQQQQQQKQNSEQPFFTI